MTKKKAATTHRKAAKRTKRSTPATQRRKAAGSQTAGRKFRMWAGIVFLVFLVIGAGLALKEHLRVSGQAKDRNQATKEGPIVQSIKVAKAPENQTLTLEGESRPFQEATIYAKLSGYLKEVRVIEGSQVKKGDILALITSPETDQGYVAALADAHNKDRIAQRYKALLDQGLVSPQEAEQNFASAQVADATLKSQKQLKDYETLRSPFDGVVTSRYVDPGDLISNSSNSKSTQQALLTVSDTERLKVDAYVDQKYAPYTKAGLPVETYLSERSNERFKGEISRVSGALDHKTRMLFTEIDFDNSQHKIISGSFVEVQVKIPTPHFFMLPIEALVTLNGQPAVAKIQQDHKLKFSPLHIVDNDGTNLTVLDGVTDGEVLALNVGAELKDGDTVRELTGDSASGDKGSGQQNVAKAGQGK